MSDRPVRGWARGVFLILACGVSILHAQDAPFRDEPTDDATVVTSTPPLNDLQRRGKRIYESGRGGHAADPVMALLGRPPTKVSAEVLPCANCHGFDGKGNPEGGVVPSDLSWSRLTRRYGGKHPSGRRHRAYDDNGFSRALRLGRDPSNNELDASMPRYEMCDEDMAALISYIRVIENDSDPGVEDDRVRIATLVWGDEAAASLSPHAGAPARHSPSQVVESVLRECAEQLTLPYGRRLELAVCRLPGDGLRRGISREDLPQIEAFLDAHPSFAILAPVVGADLAALGQLADRRQIPVLVPLGTPPAKPDSDNRYLFHLQTSAESRIRALVDACVQKLGVNDHAVLLTSTPERGESADAEAATSESAGTREINAVRQQANKRGLALEVITADAETDEIRSADAILYFGSKQVFSTFLRRLAEGLEPRRVPYVFTPSRYLSAELFSAPRTFRGRLFSALPNSTSVESTAAVRAYQRIVSGIEGEESGSALHRAVYVGYRLFEEGLRRSGRALRRGAFIAHLEQLYEFETGLMPALTFGPHRRCGSHGAFIIGIDLDNKRLDCTGHWVDPDRLRIKPEVGVR